MCYGKPEYWPTPDPVTYNRYLDALTDFTNWLIQRGYRILLFVSARYDRGATEDLKDRLRERHGQETLTHLVEPSISCVDELLREVSSAEFVVATRFHGVLLSHILLKPVIAISWDRKVDAHMEDVQQLTYCLDIRHLNTRQLRESFALLEANATQVREDINKSMSAYRLVLDSEYERLLQYATTQPIEK